MMQGPDHRIYPLGDASLEVSLGDRIDPSVHQRVIALWQALKASPLPGQIDLTPSYCTLALHFDRRFIAPIGFKPIYDALMDRIASIQTRSTVEMPILRVPVCYESDHAPDLKLVAERLQCAASSIIEKHTASTYTVYLLGFLPGFPYMGALSSDLQLPRKERPDPVESGTVAIAANQTGIYPSNSPGGWWRIGQTPLRLFDPTDPRIVLFEPGDRVQFYSIDSHAFSSIESEVKHLSISSLREKGGWT